jgi:hypothetical protein
MRANVFMLAAFAAGLYFGGRPVFAQHGGHGPAGRAAGPPATRGGSPDGQPAAHDNKNTPPDAGKKTPGELLKDNTRLAANLQALLPKGTDLQTAANGFKNLGQFVAAVHASNNLGIPFDSLRAKLTSTHPASLGQAIQDLRPSSDSKAETKRAEAQAQKDLEEPKEPRASS